MRERVATVLPAHAVLHTCALNQMTVPSCAVRQKNACIVNARANIDALTPRNESDCSLVRALRAPNESEVVCFTESAVESESCAASGSDQLFACICENAMQ